MIQIISDKGLFYKYRVSVWDDENALDIDGGDDYTAL